MNPTFVIDASVTMAWCFSEEATPATIAVLDRLKTEAALVPRHWFLEVANSLAMAEKRGRIAEAESDRFIVLLNAIDLRVDDEGQTRVFSHILPLARSHRLTTYDATYLDLTLRRQLPLASLDKELRTAASQYGIELIGR